MTRGQQYRRAIRDLYGRINTYPNNTIYDLSDESPMLHDKIRDFFQFFEPGDAFENSFLGLLNLLADTTKAVSNLILRFLIFILSLIKLFRLMLIGSSVKSTMIWSFLNTSLTAA